MAIVLSKNQVPSNVNTGEEEPRVAHILLMGLTGGGKSTFIYRATGDEQCLIGHSLKAGTTDVADYTLNLDGYEVHLIDTPGFDDPDKSDAEVLESITIMLNAVHKLGEPLAGVLYLHDVGRIRMQAGGERNIRLLEKLLGKVNYASCTLVTTHWGTLKDSQKEENNANELASDKDYWKVLRSGDKPAQMVRFENTKNSALSIIRPLLGNTVITEVTQQMIVRGNMAVGDTDAGKLVGDSGKRRYKAEGRLDKIEEAKVVLQRKFDQEQFEEFRKERQALKRKMRMKRAGRWSVRAVVVSGGLFGTLLFENPAIVAGAFTVSGALEKKAYLSKEKDKAKVQALEEKYGIVNWRTVDINAL